MQLIKTAERTFVGALVAKTKNLVGNNELSTPQKVAHIQRALAENVRKCVSLRERRVLARAERERTRLDALIQIRERATAYLAATAKWLVHIDQHPDSIRHMPQVFAVPSWEVEEKQVEKPKKSQEFPFMEFSS